MPDKIDQIDDTNIQSTPELSVVVPVHNEAGNIEPLMAEVIAALDGIELFEIIYIDDCSRDGTPEKLVALNRKIESLRVLTHEKQSGQSAAIRTGVMAARGRLIATLDGDGQNDPADIPKLLKAYQESSADNPKTMIVGHRAKRQDSLVKRLSSKIANGIRASLLGDATPDTGCGLKVFRRQDFLDLPSFDHMHRFLPALMLRNGGQVVSVEVSHRSRERGKSKYGTFDRLWVGITDLIGVMWLKRRSIDPEIKEDQ
ncbi:MAG: glycosyltransferase family 2 protein [Rhodospirillaceae bacterium]|jgi:dolichol-phosphate mannosyltransferase|nr:glycosyltransferase family 2 protein [Rhodospirillaceae bacterium]MBT7954210.1 glycosyltransferase family 2 protein [Rhodospirillaceae bacterium]